MNKKKFTYVEVDILEVHDASSMSRTRDVNHASSILWLEKRWHNKIGEQEVSDMIDCEVPLNPLAGSLEIWNHFFHQKHILTHYLSWEAIRWGAADCVMGCTYS